MKGLRESGSVLRCEQGRTVLETLLTLMLVGVLVVIAADRFSRSIRSIKERALVIELGNLRNAVNLYAMLKGRLPPSLKVLLKEKVIAPKSDIKGTDYELVIIESFTGPMTVDKEGRPLDPFGNRYGYDPATGRVFSTTEGYEDW